MWQTSSSFYHHAEDHTSHFQKCSNHTKWDIFISSFIYIGVTINHIWIYCCPIWHCAVCYSLLAIHLWGFSCKCTIKVWKKTCKQEFNAIVYRSKRQQKKGDQMYELEEQQVKQSSYVECTCILCKGKFNGNSQKSRGMRAADARGREGEKGNTVPGGDNRGQKMPEKEKNCSTIHFSERLRGNTQEKSFLSWTSQMSCQMSMLLGWLKVLDFPLVPARLMQTFISPPQTSSLPCTKLSQL